MYKDAIASDSLSTHVKNLCGNTANIESIIYDPWDTSAVLPRMGHAQIILVQIPTGEIMLALRTLSLFCLILFCGDMIQPMLTSFWYKIRICQNVFHQRMGLLGQIDPCRLKRSPNTAKIDLSNNLKIEHERDCGER